MPFDSYVFVLFFLPLLVLVWRAVAIVHKPALGPVLLGASILFCFWASPAALLILGLMILVNYGLGLALAAPGEREGSLRRKGLLFLALVLNFPSCALPAKAWFPFPVPVRSRARDPLLVHPVGGYGRIRA